jgi:5-methylcytosine-specific restriction endonuclease McrA
MNAPVLILNHNYEPLQVCDTRRALVLVYVGKAEIVENGRGEVRTVSRLFPKPSVIRLRMCVAHPFPRIKLSKKEIFRRDEYRCQYCGRPSRTLTVDHVLPRHRGGPHTWTNLVSACPLCNRSKGGRTPQEARMHLRRPPFEPRPTRRYLFGPYLDGNEEWRKFIEGW